MVNQELFEQFRKIAKDRRTGVLAVTVAERRLRYCFQNGELMMLDLGEDKELLMARKFLDYHKIGPEIHRHVVDSATSSKTSIVEVLRRQQLVTDSEVSQIAQTMVEDVISVCFSVPHQQAVFADDQGPDSFDLEHSAIRLRIPVERLLTMVESRINAEEALFKEVGSWEAVFAHEEGSPSADLLDDFEKHVLNFIDGRKSVEDIAVSFRDSTPNMARVLVSLARKGYISRTSGMMSRRRAAMQAQAQAQATPSGATPIFAAPADGAAAAGGPGAQSGAARPAGTSSSTDFVPYVNNRMTEPTSRRSLVVLLSVLGVAVLVGVLVVRFQMKQDSLTQLTGGFDEALAARQWDAARETVADARAKVADPASRRRVVDMESRLDAALSAELELIGKLIDTRDFTAAAERLDSLPRTLPTGNLAVRLDEEKAAFDAVSERIRRDVNALIDQGDVTGALALISRYDEQERALGTAYIERWRLSSLEAAVSPGSSLGERQAILNRILEANPTPLQRERIAQLQEELLRGQNRRQEQMRQVRLVVEKGAWREAEADIARQNLLEQAPGSALQAESNELGMQVAAVRKELEGAAERGMNVLREEVDGARVAALVGEIDAILARYTQASNAEQLQAIASAAAAIAPLVGQGTTDDEATRLTSWLAQQTVPAEVAEILSQRIARMHNAASAAATALDYARSVGQEGRWDEAITSMELIAKRAEWRRTATGLAIEKELAQARNTKARREVQQVEFRKALTGGDIPTAYALARELGLKYLPLMIESHPSGAEVLREGKRLGTTPLVLEVGGGERAEFTVELRLPSYEPLRLAGTEAVAGWRLVGQLQRQAVARIELGMIVTNRPAVAADRLWLANSSQVAAIAADGTVTRHPFDNAPGLASAARFDQPVYAAAAGFDDGVYLTTRDMVALRIRGSQVTRLALGARSDFPIEIYRSQVVLNRRYLMVAGLDGVLHANDERDPGVRWQGTPGQPFACAPRLVGDTVLVARTDGRLESRLADNGVAGRGEALGAPVLGAWPVEDGLAGLTAKVAWHWDGKRLLTTPLPREPVACGQGILVTGDRQAYVQGADGAWTHVGRHDGTLSGPPLAWQGQAVLPVGGTLQVVGAHGFTVSAPAQFIGATRFGEMLAAVTADGRVFLYRP